LPSLEFFKPAKSWVLFLSFNAAHFLVSPRRCWSFGSIVVQVFQLLNRSPNLNFHQVMKILTSSDYNISHESQGPCLTCLSALAEIPRKAEAAPRGCCWTTRQAKSDQIPVPDDFFFFSDQCELLIINSALHIVTPRSPSRFVERVVASPSPRRG
jgi:hypothetical protein